MKSTSLRFRLLGAAIVVILVALPVAGVGLLVLFERNVVRQMDIELEADVEQLIANVERDADGDIDLVVELADPRFRRPFGGRYWQISSDTNKLLRSASLWEAELLAQPEPAPEDGIRWMYLEGPNKVLLYSAVRAVVLTKENDEQKDVRLLMIAALDAAEIEVLKRQFRGDVVKALGLLALLLLGASFLQVMIGLRPFEVLRTGLEDIRLGKAARLAGGLPQEVQPLATETNRLLDAQEQTIVRARARAGDLAHGLKTPLTAITMIVQQLRDEGRAQIAADIDGHLREINQHVDRQLARSRIASDVRLARRVAIAPILTRLVRTMSRLPRGDMLDWQTEVAPGAEVRLDEADLAEMLGNLLDNARKWARSNVGVTLIDGPHSVELSVWDDGPGVPPEAYGRVLRRGQRLDETKPGSGLGLAIVKDIVEAYDGEVELAASESGGLLVRLRLPAA